MKPFGSDDIRGIYPETINEKFAYKLGIALAIYLSARKVVVGNDIRLSGDVLKDSIINGLTDAGCDVIDIGQCGTEMIYFATSHLKLDGGVMITASHNPKEYNGFKLVGRGSRPISNDTGLNEIEILCNENISKNIGAKVERYNIIPEYISHLISYVDVHKIKPLKVVANTGNGAAGPVINELEKYLPLNFIKIYNEPDGNFPNGVPNPILKENRKATSDIVKETGADIGIAWDGDFDRCFLFDENGNMVEGYYMVGVLAEAFLKKNKGAKIIHDPRVYWNTQDICQKYGGKSIICRSGHAHIKEKMRREDAVYGGEMSAHHYFRDFFYCDSGMIPWLLVLELMSLSNISLSKMIVDRLNKFPCSGEINTKVSDMEAAKDILKDIEDRYSNMPGAVISYVDGIDVSFSEWRFNLRMSNTEPVIRLNVEAINSNVRIEEKISEILNYSI